MPNEQPAPEREQAPLFSPIAARTQLVRDPVRPIAYDYVKMIVIRSGSATLLSGFGQQSLSTGDVVLLSANTLCGIEPDAHITVTTMFADADYVIDQIYWQNVGLLEDRRAAQDFAVKLYTEAVQVIRIGRDRLELLSPWLDELVMLSTANKPVSNFYRMQALWFAITHVISPFIKTSPVRTSRTQRQTRNPALPRVRRLAPLRVEVREAERMLRADPAGPWSVGGLAARANLSKSQFGRLFVDAYGKPPMAYLTMLRVEQMAASLRASDSPIAVVAREVGWSDSDFAALQFRRSVGVTPSRYRAMIRSVKEPTSG
ncbi:MULTISPECIES: AraC family transcriptional regulator [unclassified Microbacterium]|uniref:AraC family transcriptional regulator n=1 Tax=unclassified Microbacterium TaxID=2609290 RepID=UPI0030167EF5